MTDFEKLMNLLKIPKEKREELFVQLIKGDKTLYLEFHWDGSILGYFVVNL